VRLSSSPKDRSLEVKVVDKLQKDTQFYSICNKSQFSLQRCDGGFMLPYFFFIGNMRIKLSNFIIVDENYYLSFESIFFQEYYFLSLD
jgi:hypothetical protein